MIARQATAALLAATHLHMISNVHGTTAIAITIEIEIPYATWRVLYAIRFILSQSVAGNAMCPSHGLANDPAQQFTARIYHVERQVFTTGF